MVFWYFEYQNTMVFKIPQGILNTEVVNFEKEQPASVMRAIDQNFSTLS